MKTIRLSIIISLWLLAGQIAAAPALLVFGASLHGSCNPQRYQCDLNGFNPGLGLEWNFEPTWAGGRLLARTGAYRDSYAETAVFAAGGWRRVWPIASDWEAGVVLLAGYLKGSDINGLIAIPLLTVGTPKLALEVGYIPKIKAGNYRGNVPVTTFNLRYAF
ncbi:hypothetical protein [Craterilacuibacter sp.]|uniref:hypothetical protein n=1 Tax=Craterilacuibacter sp. TaxID=2870909 RepID=UPI003F3A4297